MTAWNKTTVIEWFRQRVGHAVVLRQPSTLLRMVGTIHNVDELDACSADIHTVDFECGLDDVSVSLSFHAGSLSLHVLAKPLHRQEATLSLPISIPYGDLDLRAAGEGGADAQDEEARSPYELLHQ
jgi:hypothetical protein